MGMATRLYGCIEEYGLLKGIKQNEVYHHNRKVIGNLPIKDEWPPLTRNMFAITHCDLNRPGINYAYSGRIIHFGANFKSIEHEWREWKDKFENLLTRLYWLSAAVHFKTEYTDIQTFTWEIDLDKWSIPYESNGTILPIKKDYWRYEGAQSWES
ncbi:hypothetical protein [Hymenobacter defluvii]|uniref:hypothetical protein n=1 Tax=Hymenobacter defluvii TaxID=2054411 RepID=UPI001AAFF51B|nr:hypothetical protein [Hymenobacter defluvii]